MSTVNVVFASIMIQALALSCCLDNCPCRGRIEDRAGNCALTTCAQCTSSGAGWCDVAVRTDRGMAQCVALPDEDEPSVAPEGCAADQWHAGIGTCPPTSGGRQ